MYKDAKRAPAHTKMDSEITLQLMRIYRKKVQKLSINERRFELVEFAAKLKHQAATVFDLDNVPRDIPMDFLEATGKQAYKMGKFVPALTFLQGSFRYETTVKEVKKARARRAKFDASQLERTQITVLSSQANNGNGQASDSGADAATEKRVQEAFKQLVQEFRSNGKKPVNYFRFVVDPDSFSRTVENVFHASFLVSEGKMSLEVSEEDGSPYVRPLKKSHNVVENGETRVKKQVIINVNMPDWERIKEKMNIKKAFLKRSH